MNIYAAPSSSGDNYSLSESTLTSAGNLGLLFDVRANDGASRTRPLYSLDNAQVSDLAHRDQASSASTTADRSALGAAIWITSDGRVGYSTSTISSQVESLAAGERLQDSFVYATQQANGSLLWTTVRITITGTNDVPVAVADIASAAEDELITGSVATNDYDIDNGAVLRFAASNSLPGFQMNSNGSWGLDASHPAFQSLGLGESKTLSIGYTVTDQFGARSNSVLTITVTGTNDVPEASALVMSGYEGGLMNGWLEATDRDENATLSFALEGEAPAGLQIAADGLYSFDASHPAYAFLASGQNATVVAFYTVRDEHGAASQASLTINLVGTNDTPIAAASTRAATEDQVISGLLVATDADTGAALSYALAGDPPAGFLLAADGSWTFDAAQADYQSLAVGGSLVLTITYVVTDEHGASASSTLTLTVAGANDAPTSTLYMAEVAEGGSVSGTLLASDVDAGAHLSFAVVGTPPVGLSMNPDGSWSFDASGGAYDHLGAGETALIEVPFQVSDGQGGTSESPLAITVTGVNDGPTGPAEPIVLADGVQGSAYLVTAADLLAGWSDLDGDTLSIANVQASSGTVTANADGSFTVVADAGVLGPVTLSYVVSDGLENRSGGATFTLGDPGNEPATDFTGMLTGSVREDRIATVSGDVDFTDPDDPADTWRPVSSPTASAQGLGTFTVTASGVWTYHVNNDHPLVAALDTGESLADRFFMITADGTRVEVQVTINGRTDVDYASPVTSTDGEYRDYDTDYSGSVHPWQRNYSGGPYDDLIQGSNQADTLTGRDGFDRIYGHDGNDVIYGDVANGSVAWGDDQLFGQAGDDVIYGGSGSDRIHGGSGNDILYGNGTNATEAPGNSDRLHGGSGDDHITGSNGDDIITGGNGADYLIGGLGRDDFYFHSAAETGDTIADFQQGQDQIMINNLFLSQNNFVGLLTGEGQVESGEVGYFVENGVTTIYIDTDGAPGADLEIKLEGIYAVTAQDFYW